MKNLFVIIISCLIALNSNAQNRSSELESFENNYTSYFKLNRESVFLHLNKTSFLKKENLWLSAYVYNATLNSPNAETMNLNLEIFKDSGEFVASKTVLIAQGKGSIFIDLSNKNYTAGRYFIKASTKYMENFKEDLSYVQAFEILGDSADSNTLKDINFDLQVLPEGGHILADVRNNIGIKLIDSNGSSTFFYDGKLLNGSGEVLLTFKSNQFGLSKFNFLPTTKESYSIEVTTENGKKIKKPLPNIDVTGFNIAGNNLNDQIIFKVNTNASSEELVKDKTFFAAIHQNGNIKDFAFQFPKDKLEVTMNVSKDSLYPGINTVTIFDEDFNPILERLFFNRNNIGRKRVKASVSSSITDSIRIDLKAVTAINSNSLSVSVLPAATKAYKPRHNILSAFYLKPYLSGNLENGAYYFSDANERKVDYDLDILMLTQGWSKYSWKDIANSSTPKLVAHEKGFTIDGKVSDRNEKKEKTVFIKSEETGLFEMVEIKEDNTFQLQNVYVQDSSSLSYGLMNDRNSKISKPAIYARISPNKTRSELKDAYSSRHVKVTDNSNVNFNDFVGDTESLDTIQLIGENKKTDKYRNDLKVIKPEVTITEELARRYLFITDYIGANGFRVLQGGYGNLVIENRTPSSLDEGRPPIPQIFFNGMRLGADTSPLVYLKTSEVESIIISKNGLGYGMNGNNGVIEITTRKGRGIGISSRETIKEIINGNGFTTDKEFYAPKYTSYTSDAFKYYGVIDWISNISLKQNGTASFKVLNTLQPELSLFIEGITTDGSLISEEIIIKTN